MRDLNARVAAFCRLCRNMFRVDLDAIIYAKGRSYSLIDKQGPCRLLGCEGRAFFMYSPGVGVPYRPLSTEAGDNARSAGEHRSPDDDDPPPCAPLPKAPAGVSPAAWAAADTRERARLVRKARG